MDRFFGHDFLFLFELLVMFGGKLEPPLDEVDVRLRRCDALLRFLLEGVENEDHARKLHGVNGPIGVAVMGEEMGEEMGTGPV
jgi:hypothetical protein